MFLQKKWFILLNWWFSNSLGESHLTGYIFAVAEAHVSTSARWFLGRTLTLSLCEHLSSSAYWSILIELEKFTLFTLRMGNTSSSSSRSRHISGDETGPSLTAGKFLSDSNASTQDTYEALLRSGYKVTFSYCLFLLFIWKSVLYCNFVDNCK